MNEIKAKTQIREEQDVDLTLKDWLPKKLGQFYDGVILATDTRHKHFKATEDRIFLKDKLLFTI